MFSPGGPVADEDVYPGHPPGVQRDQPQEPDQPRDPIQRCKVQEMQAAGV